MTAAVGVGGIGGVRFDFGELDGDVGVGAVVLRALDFSRTAGGGVGTSTLVVSFKDGAGAAFLLEMEIGKGKGEYVSIRDLAPRKEGHRQ